MGRDGIIEKSQMANPIPHPSGRGEMIGKRFRINLSDNSWIQDEIPQDWVLRYAGGTGLALEAFHERLTSDQEVEVIFAPGLMAGTNAPAGHWSSAVFYDPAREQVAVSYFGGHFGRFLRLFGGGLVEIQGRSPIPVVLVLEEGRVRFVDAGELKGLDPQDVCLRLENLLGHEYHVASIGFAGEMEIPIASLVFDGAYQRQSSGLGAVFGRMGLKAFAVKGNEKIVPVIPQSFYSEAKHLRNCFCQEAFPYREFSSYGSAWLFRELYQQAMLPIKNFTTSFFPECEVLSGESLADPLRRQSIACSGCPVGCRWTTPIGDRWYNGLELEEIIALGTLCGITDPKNILKIKAHCDRLGVDPLALGGAIAAVMESGEAKIGHPLVFGEGERVLKVFEEEENPEIILVKLGVLSDTTRTLLRNLSWVGFMNTDPRTDSHLALQRITWPFEEPHVLSSGAFLKELPLFADPGEEMGVARRVVAYQDFYLGLQSLGFCPWASLTFTPRGLDALLRAALGDGLPDEAILRFGRAVIDSERSRSSFLQSNSPPMDRFRKLGREPVGDGPRKGQRFDITQPWQDYLKLRDHPELDSVSLK